MMINGGQHYPIHWNYRGYKDEYVDFSYVHKTEDVLKSTHIWHSPGEVPVTPEQHELAAVRRQEALKRVCKSRESCRTELEESSFKSQRIVKDDDTLELNIDPFSEVSPEERVQASQKRPPKPPLEERLQASQKKTIQATTGRKATGIMENSTQATTGRKVEMCTTARR